MFNETVLDRLMKKVEVDPSVGIYLMDGDGQVFFSPCMIWKGARNERGYGNFRLGKRVVKAHRAMYGEVVDGEIHTQPYLDLDHLCCRHECINPDHLDKVSHDENNKRGDSLEKHALRSGRMVMVFGQPVQAEEMQVVA